MEISTFCRQSRVLVVAGKGGVGKTTMTAALARMAAQAGLSVLVVELEGKPGVPAAFGRSEPLDYDGSCSGGRSRGGRRGGRRPVDPEGTVRARRITPDDALLEYLADHGMKRISKRLVSSGPSTSCRPPSPASGTSSSSARSSSLERQGAADLILVDAPATGHAMTFLSSAQGLMDAAALGARSGRRPPTSSSCSVDPARCQVALVTLPEEMPVNEVVEAAYALEDRIGHLTGAGHRQRLLSPPRRVDDPGGPGGGGRGLPGARTVEALERPASSGPRQQLQGERARLAHELPLPQLHAPFLFSAAIGPAELDALVRRWPTGSRRSTTRPRRRRDPQHRRSAVHHRSGGEEPLDRQVCCGSGGRGQDHGVGRLRPRRRPTRAPGLRRDHRPGQAPRRRARASTSLTNTPAGSTGTGPASCGRSCSTPRAPSTTSSRRYARTPEQAEAILANRLYRNLTGALSGTQEYMAMEKLYELSDEGSSTWSSSTPRRRATRSTSSTRRAG